jgi:hypothetical protein
MEEVNRSIKDGTYKLRWFNLRHPILDPNQADVEEVMAWDLDEYARCECSQCEDHGNDTNPVEEWVLGSLKGGLVGLLQMSMPDNFDNEMTREQHKSVWTSTIVQAPTWPALLAKLSAQSGVCDEIINALTNIIADANDTQGVENLTSRLSITE